ncbi:hypothetical protein AALO_G00108920 [Alosa alosa]|uniref:Uncharacterized protein n=1 Tax=Alosa alosa TaxID=278164 RepID=A0AAV6GSV4_9TELE|nr:hypothetical protein AALO_G00108920 [Alosa alosa]
MDGSRWRSSSREPRVTPLLCASCRRTRAPRTSSELYIQPPPSFSPSLSQSCSILLFYLQQSVLRSTSTLPHLLFYLQQSVLRSTSTLPHLLFYLQQSVLNSNPPLPHTQTHNPPLPHTQTHNPPLPPPLFNSCGQNRAPGLSASSLPSANDHQPLSTHTLRLLHLAPPAGSEVEAVLIGSSHPHPSTIFPSLSLPLDQAYTPQQLSQQPALYSIPARQSFGADQAIEGS